MTTGSARSTAQSFEQFQTEAQEAMRRIQKDRLRSEPEPTEQQIQSLYNHVENLTVLLSDYIHWSSTPLKDNSSQRVAASSQSK